MLNEVKHPGAPGNPTPRDPFGRLRAGSSQAQTDTAIRDDQPRLSDSSVVRLPPTVRLDVADARCLPLEAASVDLIVTSPPYGLDIAYDTPAHGRPDDPLGWAAFMADWLAEAYRVARPAARLAVNVPLDTTRGAFRPTYAQTVAAACAVGWRYRFSIVWNEGHVSKSVARGSVDSASAPHVIAPVEMVAVFYTGEWRRDPHPPSDPTTGSGQGLAHEEWLAWTSGLWTFGGETRPWEGHPAPFPAELPRRLVKLLSFPGDVVLDPFVGSGTTVLVAWRHGRVALGFDVSARYIASARRRVRDGM